MNSAESNRRWAERSQERARERRRREPIARTGVDPSKRREAVRSDSHGKKGHPSNKIKPRSNRGKAEDAKYARIKAEYLAKNATCHHCLEMRCAEPLPATEVHHTAGRGTLLCDTRFWMAVNKFCHVMGRYSIHENPATAHRKGWLLTRGDTERALVELMEKRGQWSWVQRELEGEHL